MRLINKYFQLLEIRPFRTKVATAVVIFAVGDVSAQYFEHYSALKVERKYNCSIGPFAWDCLRTLRIVTFGVGVTSWLHVWWGFLERTVEKHVISAVSHRYKNAFVKVFLDQLIGSPLFNVFFFSSQSILQGKTLETTWSDVQVRVPAMLKLHYCFWPWVHLVNFSLFPLHRRLLVHNVLTVGWIALLSHKNQHFDRESNSSS